MAGVKLSELLSTAPKDIDKEKIKLEFEKIIEDLNELQNLLYAESKHSVLVVLQGMDGSGKDRTIRNVFGRLNPLGVKAHPFKEPTARELAHDFLWRIHRKIPAKGNITVFNRSHYEDVLVTRVHGLIDDETAKMRMKAINEFEELLQVHNNTRIFKFYLHVSHDEQLKRLEARIRDHKKQWKHNRQDFDESARWDEYMSVYEDAFNHCDRIPWMIVPADQKWYKDYVVAKTVRDTLEKLGMKYPGLKQ